MTLSRRLSQLEKQHQQQQEAEPTVFDIFYRDHPGAELRFDQRIPAGTPMDYPGDVSQLIIGYRHCDPPAALVPTKGNDDE